MAAMLVCKNLTPTLWCVGNPSWNASISSSSERTTTTFGAFNGLWLATSSSNNVTKNQQLRVSSSSSSKQRAAAKTRSGDLSVRAASGNGAAPQQFDYDVVIIGAGVGGHGAALHAVEKVRDPDFLSSLLG